MTTAKEQAALAKAAAKAAAAAGDSSSASDAGNAANAAASMMAIQKAMQTLMAEQQKKVVEREAHAKVLAAVAIKKEDVDALAKEWDHIPRPALERHLRECKGDVNAAARQLVGVEPLSMGPA